MKKMRVTQLLKTIGIYGVISVLVVLAGLPAAGANRKADELRQKMADMALLHQQLKDRKQQTEALRNALYEQHNALLAEVNLLRKTYQINTSQQARQHLRVRYNVELLRIIMAYISELDSKIRSYEIGRDKLHYLSQLAEDDIKMITTLNDLQIDALTTQISLLINQYLPEAHILRIDPAHIEPATFQSVWEDILRGKK